MIHQRLIGGLIAVAVALPSAVGGQHAWSAGGQQYDPAVPRPLEVLGLDLGARFTPHHVLARYLERVAAASPRVTLDTVALTFEGREVFMAVVTSAANHARLAAIRAAAARVADPRGASAAELEQAVRELPSIVWLGYTVHGNEASGVEAAIALLYQLAAGQDGDTRMILDSTVVLIDPVQNPDGHERHVQDVLRRRGAGASGIPALPGAMVHSGSWPGARTSHYYFDLNRDWFVHSHPETRGRVAAMTEWWPHVAVDLHEMGSGSTYFFAPPMEPVNKNVHPGIEKWWTIYAASNAAAFDRWGWSFFRREGYDEFYPGYGVSWPILTGAAGMTYEQASSSGGAIRRADGTVMTLFDAAHHHYTAAFATALTTAQRRTERVRDYLEFRRTATTDAERAAMRYIVVARDHQGRADSLAAMLLGNAIEVHRLGSAAEVRAATDHLTGSRGPARFAAGDYVIDLAQPQGRLAKALLEPDAQLDSSFIAAELESRRTGQDNRFYDVTAWSLPFLFRVDAWWTGTPPGPLLPVAAASTASYRAPAEARYGYAFEAGSEAAIRLLAGLLADSVRVWYAPRGFRAAGVDFPRGAFVVRVAQNDATVHERVRSRAAAHPVPIAALGSAMVEEGTDLGSNSVFFVRPPRVALAGGPPISGNSFGFAWFAFDQRIGYPVTTVELASLGGLLDELDVVVVPSAGAGGLDAQLGEAGRNRLAAWVREGGVLVTLDAATGWLASERLGLSRFRLRRDSVRADSTAGAPLASSVPGAIVRTRGDTLSWLLAGVTTRDVPVLVNSDRIFVAPRDLRAGEVVLRYAPLDQLRIAGYLWPEVPERLAETPWLWTERVGSGRIIGFAGDPNFRDLWRGLLPVFANAVLLGPSR
jgi:hypothetical protein